MMMNEALIKVVRKDDGVIVWSAMPTLETAERVASLYEKVSNAYGTPEFKCTIYKAGEMTLADLPEDVQEDVKETCGAFRQANVDFKNGGFSVMASSYVAAWYPDDMFHCGTFKQEKIYSPAELRAAHKKIFGYEF